MRGMQRATNRVVARLERQFTAQFGFTDAVAAGFGRAALRLAVEAAGARGRNVLVPDFICKQVVQAVEAAGARPRFYRVSRDLVIRSATIRAMLVPPAAGIIVPHYFGRAQPEVAAISRLCREHGMVLVEDCAQTLGVAGAGENGDFCAFSFSKTDWCYGGGMVACRRAADGCRMREFRDARFLAAPALLAKYGLLNRLDFAANRPSRSRLTERAGSLLERLAGLGCENFYDAGRMDAAMSAPGAQRALRILRFLQRDASRRWETARFLFEQLAATAPQALFRVPEAGDSNAYFLLHSPAGRADHWVGEARRAGVTLRRAWPAYDEAAPGQGSPDLAWYADHLVILDVHPRLRAGEVRRIADCVKRLARSE